MAPIMCLPVFLLLVAVAFLGGVAAGRRIPSRHNVGEAKVAHEISCHFQLPHVLLNNVTFVRPVGTTQLDHILVANTGIFVIETKHYTGWIYGGENQREWTQVIFKKKSRFQNPLRQNYAHLKTLQELLQLPDRAFFSIVVFTGDAEFKTDLGKQVLRLSQLMPFLTADRPVLFNEEKLPQIVGILEMNRLRRSIETDEYHINQLMSRFGKEPNPVTLSPLKERAARPRTVETLSAATGQTLAGKPATLPNPDERYMPRIGPVSQGNKRA